MIGLPFFAPLFMEGQIVRVWAGSLQPAGGVEKAVRKLMSFPFFPLQVDALHAELEFHDFRAGDVINPRPGVTLRTAPLNHPGGAIGYRIEYGGQSVAYVTDIELGDGPIDPALLALTKDAALVILDTTYTDEELPSHVGWGHSSWQQGIRLANACGRGPAVPVPPRSRARRRVHGQDQDRGRGGAARHDRGPRRPADRGLPIRAGSSSSAFAGLSNASSFVLFSDSVVSSRAMFCIRRSVVRRSK